MVMVVALSLLALKQGYWMSRIQVIWVIATLLEAVISIRGKAEAHIVWGSSHESQWGSHVNNTNWKNKNLDCEFFFLFNFVGLGQFGKKSLLEWEAKFQKEKSIPPMPSFSHYSSHGYEYKIETGSSSLTGLEVAESWKECQLLGHRPRLWLFIYRHIFTCY